MQAEQPELEADSGPKTAEETLSVQLAKLHQLCGRRFG